MQNLGRNNGGEMTKRKSFGYLKQRFISIFIYNSTISLQFTSNSCLSLLNVLRFMHHLCPGSFQRILQLELCIISAGSFII